ncbi:MAG: hypothetical protein ACK4E5_01470 [Erythrobacter cryptus]
MMFRTGLAAAALAPLAVPALAEVAAPAPEPTLGEWIARDRELARRGVARADHPEMQQLHGDVVAALGKARTAIAAQRDAGTPPAACPPPPGEAEITSREIGTWRSARPAAEQGEALSAVMARFLAARFPCPVPAQ